MTEPNIKLELLKGMPEDAYDLVIKLLPIDVSVDSKKAIEYRKQIQENLESGKKTGYLIRKPSVPVGIAWFDIINKNARVRIELLEKFKYLEERAHIATLNELKRKNITKSVTGTLTFAKDKNFKDIILNFEKENTKAQVRVDMERISEEMNKIEKPDKLSKEFSLKKWGGKYLEGAAKLDFTCFKGTPDADVLPELDQLIAHVQFYKEFNRGRLGPIVNNSSLVLLQNKRIIGLILTIQVNSYTAIILTVDVDPDFQNKGLATYLVQNVLYNLQKAKIRRVIITVTPKNEPAFKLANKFEFKPITQRIDYCFRSKQSK
ncbi:MAG: GNAT family N-acetyltransferase [Candidatus Ranarchaeia archaeon]